jgi:hypothetical protein
MIYSVVVCDGCGEEGQVGCGEEGQVKGKSYGRWRAHVARNELKELGWEVGRKHGTDFCPECRNKS